MKNPIQTFEPNTQGRDFVIGDLHGALEVFMQLLTNLNFDPEKDRMFSVGDLVDRGPDSLDCLMLLKEKWFHAVLANHEQMMVEAFDGGYMGNFWIQNGGFWGFTALKEWQTSRQHVTNELDRPPAPSAESLRLWDALDYVRDLPYIMTVNMKDGRKFHIIHAELPPRREITDETLADPARVLELATIQSHDGDFFCWGRHLFRSFYGKDLPNLVDKVKRMGAGILSQDCTFNDKLSHIISGHTILHHPLTIVGQTNIDTCAYASLDGERKWAALTCVELDTWTFYQQTPDDFRTVTPITVNMADITEIRNGKAT